MKMITVGSSFQTPCNSSFSPIPISHNVITSSYSISNKPNSLSLSFFPNSCSINQIQQGRTGYSVSAAKKRRNGGEKLMKLAGFDEDEEDEEGDEDGVYMPFMGMTEWFQKKPSGFGEGKEYDTSVEDKLLEEIEQSRKAQLANINKLKNNPSLGSGSKKELMVNKEPEVVPSGVRVRVGNLPKKRNIHRDLQLAFKGFPAIVNISPAVSGNKKTRDPICRGFAFVYLGSEEAAKSFVQTYSKKSITFGKTQKQISCEITNPRPSTDSASGNPTKETSTSISGQRLPSLEDDLVINSSMDDISLQQSEVASRDQSIDLDAYSISATRAEIEEDIEHINMSELDDDDMGTITVDKIDSPTPKQWQKTLAVKKKSSVKGKSEKVPKSDIPGSTKRLKIKEKAVLADVFSKYGAKTSLSLKK